MTGGASRPTTVALKVDVDTHRGTREGIPELMALFDRLSIPATFYLVFGPDNTGKAIRRVFRRRGFLGKMARTNPLRIYGLKTLLYGTLLPAPLTGLTAPETLRDLRRAGHEVGLHAWDHVDWQDHVHLWDEPRIGAEYRRGFNAFGDVYGSAPLTSGTPGWQASATSLAVQDRLGLAYASDSRGHSPFYPVVSGRRFATLQVPGTLPTMDEVLGVDGMDEESSLAALEKQIRPGELNVFTAHAEIEGGLYLEPFRRLLERLLAAGVRFVTLGEAAREAAGRAPACELVQGLVPGRAGEVAVQGRPLEPA